MVSTPSFTLSLSRLNVWIFMMEAATGSVAKCWGGSQAEAANSHGRPGQGSDRTTADGTLAAGDQPASRLRMSSPGQPRAGVARALRAPASEASSPSPAPWARAPTPATAAQPLGHTLAHRAHGRQVAEGHTRVCVP